MSIIQKLVAAVAAVFAVCSYAREITSVKIVQGSGSTKALVSLTAGEAGDGHVLYVAYGAKNCGDTLYAWANEGGVTPCLKVADDATSVSVELSGDAAKAACHKAFLVKKLETPAYNPGTYNIVEYIRQGSSGNAWFVTDYYCTGKESISAVFEGIGDSSKSYRPFGFRCESSGKKQCVIDAYNNKMNGWGFTIIKDDSSWNWVNPAKLTASIRKTELTFDLFNLKYTRATAEDSVSHDILPEYTFFREGVEKSSVPLVIFGANNNSPSGTSCLEGSVPNGGSLLYRCSIKTNDSAYARYYIPVSGPSTISTTIQPMGYLWEVVENKVIPRTTKETHYDYQNSSFVPRDINNENLPALDFHAVVPVELQAKYETVVSACNADRQIKEFSVERRCVTVSLTPGFSGGNDILYIAWGDSDKGDTLAAWGGNVYCAGEVADDATSVSVALPRGIYPNHFRAFLLKRSDIDCDGFVEYITSNGSSEFETDYCSIRGDKISIKFALGTTDGGQRIFGAWDSESTSTAIEIYTGSYTSGALNYGALANAGGTAKWPTQEFDYGIEEQILTYDSGDRKLTVTTKSHTATKTMKNSSTGEDTSSVRCSKPLAVFNSSRLYNAGQRVKSGAKFYWMEIANSSGVPERSYFPAKKGNEYGIWDAVQNRFIAPREAKSFSAQSDLLAFSSLPMDKQSKYLTVVDSATAYRKKAGLRITIR